jgi:hypothetical protein
MADYQAIWTVCHAIRNLLRDTERPESLGDNLEFEVYLAKDFAQPMSVGVSLFLYRILPNGTHRTPTGRIGPGGRRFQTQLPLDLHLLLTAWGKDASLQHAILGWAMRALEDTPVLTSAHLSAAGQDVFKPEETVEISLAQLRTEDLLRIWDTLVQNVYQLSVPYVARNVRIASTRLVSAGQPVQIRTLEYSKTGGGSNAG